MTTIHIHSRVISFILDNLACWASTGSGTAAMAAYTIAIAYYVGSYNLCIISMPGRLDHTLDHLAVKDKKDKIIHTAKLS